MLLIKNGFVKTMAGEDLKNGAVLIGDDGKILRPCRVSVVHQGSCASCKGARNSQALEMGNPHIK